MNDSVNNCLRNRAAVLGGGGDTVVPLFRGILSTETLSHHCNGLQISEIIRPVRVRTRISHYQNEKPNTFVSGNHLVEFTIITCNRQFIQQFRKANVPTSYLSCRQHSQSHKEVCFPVPAAPLKTIWRPSFTNLQRAKIHHLCPVRWRSGWYSCRQSLQKE